MEAFSLTVPNLENVIFFLLPGILFIFFFFYQIPDKKKSDFTVVIWSVVVSVLINKLNEGLLKISGIHFSSTSLLFRMIALYLSYACASAAALVVKSPFFLSINSFVFGVTQFPFGRLWNEFFNVKTVTIIRVTLQDGTSYIGQLKHYSVDPEDVQELEIFNIYTYNRATAAYRKVVETESMFIRGDSILTVEKITSNSAQQIYNLP